MWSFLQSSSWGCSLSWWWRYAACSVCTRGSAAPSAWLAAPGACGDTLNTENTVSHVQRLHLGHHFSLGFAVVRPDFRKSNQPVTLVYFCTSNNYREKMGSEDIQELLIYTSYGETGLFMDCLEKVKWISLGEISEFWCFCSALFSLTRPSKYKPSLKLEGAGV